MGTAALGCPGELARQFLEKQTLHLAAIIVAFFLVICGIVCFFLCLNEQFLMQHEINLNLPPDKKFEPSLWWAGTWEEFRRLQEVHLHDSPRPQRFRKFLLAGFSSMLSGFLLLAAIVNKS